MLKDDYNKAKMVEQYANQLLTAAKHMAYLIEEQHFSYAPANKAIMLAIATINRALLSLSAQFSKPCASLLGVNNVQYNIYKIERLREILKPAYTHLEKIPDNVIGTDEVAYLNTIEDIIGNEIELLNIQLGLSYPTFNTGGDASLKSV